MDNITQIVQQHTERLFEVERQQAVHQNTFENINQTLQRMDSRLDRMEEKTDLLSEKIEVLRIDLKWVKCIGWTVFFLMLPCAIKYVFMPGIA